MLVWVSLSEFDKFNMCKTLEPAKSHVGVSESFLILQIQIKYSRNMEIINNPLILLKWHDIVDGFSFINKGKSWLLKYVENMLWIS